MLFTLKTESWDGTGQVCRNVMNTACFLHTTQAVQTKIFNYTFKSKTCISSSVSLIRCLCILLEIPSRCSWYIILTRMGWLDRKKTRKTSQIFHSPSLDIKSACFIGLIVHISNYILSIFYYHRRWWNTANGDIWEAITSECLMSNFSLKVHVEHLFNYHFIWALLF